LPVSRSLLLRVAAAVVAAVVAGGAPAATLPPNLAAVAPGFDAVQGAARQIRASGCTTVPCRAMVTIAQVLQLDLDTASATTMGLPRPIPANRDALAARALGRALLDHPRRFNVVCDGAARLLARYALPGVEPDAFVPVSLLLLGLDMDRRSGGHCLPRLVVALPHTESAAAAIGDARRSCAARPHPPVGCDAIGRP
jgi:hypothetical protein